MTLPLESKSILKESWPTSINKSLSASSEPSITLKGSLPPVKVSDSSLNKPAWPAPVGVEFARILPLTVIFCALTLPEVSTVKFPEPIFILPPVILPKSADIDDKLDTLSLSALIVLVCITPPDIEVTLLLTWPPLIKAESLFKDETLSPWTTILPAVIMVEADTAPVAPATDCTGAAEAAPDAST